MFKLVVVIPVKMDKTHEFEAMMAPLVAGSRQEEACLGYDLYPDAIHPGTYLILETWRDQEGLDRHNKTSHYQAFASQINQYLDGEIALYRIHPENN